MNYLNKNKRDITMATSTIQYLYRLTGNMYPSICLSYLVSKITPDDFYWNFSTPVNFWKNYQFPILYLSLVTIYQLNQRISSLGLNPCTFGVQRGTKTGDIYLFFSAFFVIFVTFEQLFIYTPEEEVFTFGTKIFTSGFFLLFYHIFSQMHTRGG